MRYRQRRMSVVWSSVSARLFGWECSHFLCLVEMERLSVCGSRRVGHDIILYVPECSDDSAEHLILKNLEYISIGSVGVTPSEDGVYPNRAWTNKVKESFITEGECWVAVKELDEITQSEVKFLTFNSDLRCVIQTLVKINAQISNGGAVGYNSTVDSHWHIGVWS